MSVFLERYKELGEDVEPIMLHDSIRTNTIKITNAELRSRLEEKGFRIKKIPFLKNGFYVQSRYSIGSSSEYLSGLYYIQEAASQLPVEVLKPKGIVLDCCAAPGGKTTQIAAKAEAVIALESQYKRIASLKNNLERLGVRNGIVYNIDARKFEGRFDKILVDAPCSGNLITDKNWMRKQNVENFEQRSELQKDILENMYNLLNDGGEMVYSTCTLEPEENELVIQWALETFDIKLLKIDTPGDNGLVNVFGEELDKDIAKCKRLWPNKTKTQGFFIARMKKC